jgi:hypothetical protein
MDASKTDDFMNEPLQRQAEVIVGHRLGFWWPPPRPTDTQDDITDEMIAEADAYLEAHIQWRISNVRKGAE